MPITSHPIQQMLQAFEDIDKKICSLHECSSEDFLTFNDRLKEFNVGVKEINGNSDSILNIIDSDNLSNTFTQLNFYHYQIKTYVEEFEQQINSTIHNLEDVLREINSLYLPLKNYKQNIQTFKYLITNLQLNIAYFAPNQKNTYDDEIAELTEKIATANTIFPNLEEGVEVIKNFIFDMLTYFKQIREQNIKRTSVILHQSDFSLNFVNAKHTDIISQIIALRAKTKNCYECVGQIITNLQFHDIIRQKIEHIQSIQKNLMDEILCLTQNDNTKIHKEIAWQIQHMAELQSAQLTHTNKEYQKAIEVIIKQFIDISDNMAFVVDTGVSITGATEESETPFSDVEKELNDSMLTLKDLLQSIHTFYLEASVISDAVLSIKYIFKNLFVLNADFEISIEKLITKYNENNNTVEGAKIIRHLREGGKFTQHIHTLKSIVKKILISQNEFETKVIKQQNDNTINEKLSLIKNQLGGMVQEITLANKEIMSIMNTNSDKSLDISSTIRSTIKQVKYYDFFDKQIEEIIQLLQQVYFWLSSVEIDETTEIPLENLNRLEDLKKQYTMESERLVHESILTGDSTDDIDVFESNADDDDLELF